MTANANKEKAWIVRAKIREARELLTEVRDPIHQSGHSGTTEAIKLLEVVEVILCDVYEGLEEV